MIVKKVIHIPLYRIKVKLWFYSDEDELKENLARVEFDVPIEDCDAGVFEYEDNLYVVFCLKSEITPGIIAHEAKHLVNCIYDWIEAKLDLRNDEPECYLLQYIVDQIHKHFESVNYGKRYGKGNKK